MIDIHITDTHLVVKFEGATKDEVFSRLLEAVAEICELIGFSTVTFALKLMTSTGVEFEVSEVKWDE